MTVFSAAVQHLTIIVILSRSIVPILNSLTLNIIQSVQPDFGYKQSNISYFERALCYHHNSLGSRCVPWLGEGLSMPSPNYPVLCFPLPYRVAPVFV